jgi:hypothetical protein
VTCRVCARGGARVVVPASMIPFMGGARSCSSVLWPALPHARSSGSTLVGDPWPNLVVFLSCRPVTSAARPGRGRRPPGPGTPPSRTGDAVGATRGEPPPCSGRSQHRDTPSEFLAHGPTSDAPPRLPGRCSRLRHVPVPSPAPKRKGTSVIGSRLRRVLLSGAVPAGALVSFDAPAAQVHYGCADE